VTTPAGRRIDDSGEPKSAYVACQDKLPQQPPELDEDKNPNYAAQYNNYIQCLRKSHLYVHALADGSGWTFDDNVDQPLNQDQQTKVDKTCTEASFHVG
jgi:N-dimethylarginine dimethylaminohydrolase